MSTQALLDKIVAERNEKVAAIEAESKKVLASVEAATSAAVEEIQTAAKAAGEKEAAQINRAVLAKARQTGKLIVQTARREVFDEIMTAAQKEVVGDNADLMQQFSDRRADLEMHLSKQLG